MMIEMYFLVFKTFCCIPDITFIYMYFYKGTDTALLMLIKMTKPTINFTHLSFILHNCCAVKCVIFILHVIGLKHII